MTGLTILFAGSGSLFVWLMATHIGANAALLTAVIHLALYFLSISIYVDRQIIALGSRPDPRYEDIEKRQQRFRRYLHDLNRQVEIITAERTPKITRLEEKVVALDKEISKFLEWKETSYPTHTHKNVVTPLELKELAGRLEILSWEIAELKGNPLLKIQATESAAVRLQDILDTFERVQNAQAHIATREWMLDRERFKSSVEMVSAMYRDLGIEALPEDAQKMMESRVKKIAADLFALADDQRGTRNSEAKKMIFPPPIKPRVPIDEREIMALDSE
jgi:hypothetical protein